MCEIQRSTSMENLVLPWHCLSANFVWMHNYIFCPLFYHCQCFLSNVKQLTDWLIDLMIVAWQLGEGTSGNIFPSPVVAKQLCTMITSFPTWASLLFLCPYVFTDIRSLFLSLKLWHTTHLPSSQGYNALIIVSSCCTVPLLT